MCTKVKGMSNSMLIDKHMSNYLSELSLTSVTSTEVSGETSGLYVNQLPGSREYHQTNCCKSCKS